MFLFVCCSRDTYYRFILKSFDTIFEMYQLGCFLIRLGLVNPHQSLLSFKIRTESN